MKLTLIGFGLAAFCFVPGAFADNTASITPASVQRIPYKEAKVECLKQDASLKGKALRKCVHEKRQVASTK
jgi:hypothetical protein